MAIQILDKDIYGGRGRERERGEGERRGREEREKGESHEMPTARQQYNSFLWVLDFETETTPPT